MKKEDRERLASIIDKRVMEVDDSFITLDDVVFLISLINELNSEIETLEGELTDLAHERAYLEDCIIALENEAEQLEAEIDYLVDENERLENELNY